MRKDVHYQRLIIVWIVIILAGLLTGWSAKNAYLYSRARNAYLIEKAKADAAAKVIQLAESDCADFDWEIGNSEVYWYYSQIKDLNY